MFRDRVRIKLKSGSGGNGRVAFGFNHVPTGGTGGNGGDVYLVGDAKMNDLSPVITDKIYAGEDGEHGGLKNLTGRNGKDMFLRVPIRTNVYDERGRIITSITADGQQELMLKGGIGGLGNNYFRYKGSRAAQFVQQGKPGKEIKVKLDLELQSDIIFIGLPNAGKSSALNELTNADVKVASYAFTTTIPHLGRMGNVTLMDLPGLIEDTAIGKGLGAGFAKHTKAAKIVAHFVSLESDDVIRDYETIRKEMEAIDPTLADKPEIIVLTKTDLVPAADAKAKEKLFKKYKRPIALLSNFDFDAVQKLRSAFEELVSQSETSE
jgi:GTP-binding protein